MLKTQVEPRATGEWFHCQVLNILWRPFVVYKSITIENCRRFGFYNNIGKVLAEVALFSVEKALALHLTSFLSVLKKTIATSQSTRGNFDRYCKIPFHKKRNTKQHKIDTLSQCEN